ncbi:GlxA family transcriptional regulator [Actinokineospora fastidiosa]|uniref:HTH araC/xylS-type domain-containing protein n=1 Tax=Actinokineospora fastidiosa TaxID=1816 RepID=A0A918GMJ1_9PSEU|nr:helix-turn-helix domain-containing protein [Actinokineospora fastidiosa]GGS47480.1 hypothetical protein GCM10010171_48410 [Actinokineospora fastidiosa]
MHRVAVLATDGVVGFELGIPTLVFATAIHLIGAPRYSVRICTPNPTTPAVATPAPAVPPGTLPPATLPPATHALTAHAPTAPTPPAPVTPAAAAHAPTAPTAARPRATTAPTLTTPTLTAAAAPHAPPPDPNAPHAAFARAISPGPAAPPEAPPHAISPDLKPSHGVPPHAISPDSNAPHGAPPHANPSHPNALQGTPATSPHPGYPHPAPAHATPPHTAGPHPNPPRTATAEAGRYAIHATCDLDDLAAADTLILPARAGFADEPPPGVLDAIRAAAARGARIASICTGAFDLARTGLLDGKRATTHWRFADELARRHPAITVDPAVLYVDEGDILSSAGAAAGIDLCLHLVRRDHGAAFAAEVARAIVAPPQRDGGQAQYLRHPDPADPDRSLRPTLDWLRANLSAPVTVPAIARHAGLSPRALTRRFQAEVGAPPLRWLLRERVRRAQHLLETTDLAVDRVAAESGFATAVTLRHHFTRVVGTSPQSYRRTFRA